MRTDRRVGVPNPGNIGDGVAWIGPQADDVEHERCVAIAKRSSLDADPADCALHMVDVQGSQRRLNVTPCFAQAAVPTMLWYAIPITIDRIRGLKFVIPGSILMPNEAPATIEVRQRPGKISRARRPDHWLKEMRRALLLSFSGTGDLLAEIRVTSWLHWLLPPISRS